jgi:hypothetical protein
MTAPGFGSGEIPDQSARGGPDPPPSPGHSSSESEAGLTPEQARLLPFYHDLRNEIVEPDKVVVNTQYFWTKWAPRLGPTLTALVVCLRRHCYYNRATRERRDWCFPEQATLAREIGVESTKTIRAALGHPLAARFVRREARYVYDPARGKKIRTSDVYHVALDDPLTPEDETLLALRAAERLLAEGQKAELAPPAATPRRPSGKNDRQVQGLPAGQKVRQVGRSDGEFTRQDSTPFSTPEVVHEDSTHTTKYNEAVAALAQEYEAANATTATPAQLSRLAALCAQFDPIARQDDPPLTGVAWVRAAIREAVESGSSYVAPKRIARICERWSREGGPGRARVVAGAERGRRHDDDLAAGEMGSAELGTIAEPIVIVTCGPAAPDGAPCGRRASRPLVSPVWAGEIPALQASENPEHDRVVPAPAPAVDFPELGLSGRAVWQAIGDEARRRVVLPGDVTLLAGSRLVERAEDCLIVGVPGRAAAQRAQLRLASALSDATRAILGRSVEVHFVSFGEWAGRPSE